MFPLSSTFMVYHLCALIYTKTPGILPSIRIYSVADIHGKCRQIKVLTCVARRYHPDLVVIAGDITGYFNWKPTLAHLAHFYDSGKAGPPGPAFPPIFCVRGNSDFKRAESEIAQSRNIDALQDFLVSILARGILSSEFTSCRHRTGSSSPAMERSGIPVRLHGIVEPMSF